MSERKWFKVWGFAGDRQRSVILQSDDKCMAMADVICQYAQLPMPLDFEVWGCEEFRDSEVAKIQKQFDNP